MTEQLKQHVHYHLTTTSNNFTFIVPPQPKTISLEEFIQAFEFFAKIAIENGKKND